MANEDMDLIEGIDGELAMVNEVPSLAIDGELTRGDVLPLCHADTMAETEIEIR